MKMKEFGLPSAPFGSANDDQLADYVVFSTELMSDFIGGSKGGTRDACPLEVQIAAVFGKNVQYINRLPHPLWELVPLRKILDLPLACNKQSIYKERNRNVNLLFLVHMQ